MSMVNEMKDKYNALDASERKMLVIGSVFVTLFIVYSLLYKPMVDSIAQYEKSNSENQELLIWMKQSAASLSGNTSGKNTIDKRKGRALNVVINTTATSARLNISRSQPRDNKQYQIWLDQVVFNDLLSWLDVLQKDYGIFVSNINLSTTDEKGKVRVNLTFQDSGS